MYFLPSDPFIEALSIQPLATRFLKNKTLPYRLRLIQNNYRGAAGGGDIAVICCAQEDGADIFHLTFSFLLFTIRTLWICATTFFYVNDAPRKWSPFERCCSATTAQGGQVGGGWGAGGCVFVTRTITWHMMGPSQSPGDNTGQREKKKDLVTLSARGAGRGEYSWPSCHNFLTFFVLCKVNVAEAEQSAATSCRPALPLRCFESSHRQIGIMRQEIRLNLTSIKDSISNVNNRKPDSPMWIIAQQRGIFSNAK